MARRLVVETEVLAMSADLVLAADAAHELERRRLVGRELLAIAVRRPERIREERLLDVREQELLVLLLVVEPEQD